jgi:hypothetical protein
MRKLEGSLRVSIDFLDEDSERIAETLKGPGRRPFGRSERSHARLSQAAPPGAVSLPLPCVPIGDQSRVDTSTVRWYKGRTWRRGKWLFLLQFDGSSPNPFLGTTFS